MPLISHFYGLKIYMYFNDNVQHKKPHIHVFYGEHEAVIGIDGELLAGSLPTKQYRLVNGWIVLHEEELYSDWIEAVQGKTPSKIQPLS